MRNTRANTWSLLHVATHARIAAHAPPHPGFRVTASLGEYDTFGEEGFLTREPSPVSVRATTYCDLMTLHEAAFAEVSRRFPQLAELLDPERRRKVGIFRRTGSKGCLSTGGAKKLRCAAQLLSNARRTPNEPAAESAEGAAARRSPSERVMLARDERAGEDPAKLSTTSARCASVDEAPQASTVTPSTVASPVPARFDS